jgi:hypothetical protein
VLKTIKNILRPVKYAFLFIFAFIVSKVNELINKDFSCSKETKRCSENIKSPNYRYELLGKNTPVCCATNLYTILKDLVDFFEENNIEYFISFGTLLGAKRHGGLIPWDTDIDIVIAEKEQKKVFNLLQKYYKNYDISMDKYNGMVGDIIRVNFSKINHLHVDIFIYRHINNEVHLGLQEVLPYNKIFPLTEIKFYDLNVKAPYDIDYFLRHFFGKDYMDYAYKQWSFKKYKFKLQDYKPAPIKNEK